MKYTKGSILSEDGWETYIVCSICNEKIVSTKKKTHEVKCEEEFILDKMALAQNIN